MERLAVRGAGVWAGVDELQQPAAVRARLQEPADRQPELRGVRQGLPGGDDLPEWEVSVPRRSGAVRQQQLVLPFRVKLREWYLRVFGGEFAGLRKLRDTDPHLQ